MRVYLMRHGKAVSKKTDPERPLAAEGRRQIAAVARRLAKIGIRPAEVRHSPKLRARQTAEIAAEALGSRAVEVPGLRPNDPVGPIARALETGAEDVMIAGHLPSLENLVSLLVARDESAPVVDMPTGAVVTLERDDDEEVWRIVWMLTPETA